MNIIYRKKECAPRYTEKQTKEVLACAQRLYRTLLNGDFDLIMNNEKYFTLIKDVVSTNRGFYTSDLSITVPNVKFKRVQNYSAQVLF